MPEFEFKLYFILGTLLKVLSSAFKPLLNFQTLYNS